APARPAPPASPPLPPPPQHARAVDVALQPGPPEPLLPPRAHRRVRGASLVGKPACQLLGRHLLLLGEDHVELALPLPEPHPDPRLQRPLGCIPARRDAVENAARPEIPREV